MIIRPAGDQIEDWIDQQQSVRPLPITVRPAHDETVESYLARLGAANLLTVDHLRRYLTGSTHRRNPVPIARLALLSGQPRRTLVHAIHELDDPNHRHPGRPDTGRAGLRRSPCTLCARGRGHTGWIVCWANHQDAVCLQHARWLGDGHASNARQLSLRQHPDILEANRVHRRIVRRAGRVCATNAYNQAVWIVDRWHHKRIHHHDFHRHMADFHGPSWRVNSSDTTINAATYPQTVALTRLLTSPHWQAKSRMRPEPTEFIAEVRATVAPHYHWTLARPYGTYEPLVELILESEPSADRVTRPLIG